MCKCVHAQTTWQKVRIELVNLRKQLICALQNCIDFGRKLGTHCSSGTSIPIRVHTTIRIWYPVWHVLEHRSNTTKNCAIIQLYTLFNTLVHGPFLQPAQGPLPQFWERAGMVSGSQNLLGTSWLSSTMFMQETLRVIMPKWHSKEHYK